ncbi:hypothetical protein ACVWWK_002267 [Bradyrhizobium sp. LB9.1b]
MRKSLNARLAAVQEAVKKTSRSGIQIVTILGCLPQPLSYAESGGRNWVRRPRETVDEFEARVVVAAKAAGLRIVTIGGLPLCNVNGTLEDFLAHFDFAEVPPEQK